MANQTLLHFIGVELPIRLEDGRPPACRGGFDACWVLAQADQVKSFQPLDAAQAFHEHY